jgi:hypothetical protein
MIPDVHRQRDIRPCMGCSPQEEMNKQEKTEGTEENWQVSPFAPRPPVQSDRADRHEGKKMSGKKMKIGFGPMATPTSIGACRIFFHPTFFFLSAVEKEFRQRVTRITP